MSTEIHSYSSQVDVVKILYPQARRTDRRARPLEMAQLAAASHAGTDNNLPLSLAAADACLSMTEDPEIVSWAASSKARWYMHWEHYRLASSWFEKSIRSFPNWKSALLLSRSRFMEKDWRGCVESYSMAQSLHDSRSLIHDDTPVSFERSLILVTSALDKLSMHTEARAARDALTKIFPNHPAIANLAQTIG